MSAKRIITGMICYAENTDKNLIKITYKNTM